MFVEKTIIGITCHKILHINHESVIQCSSSYKQFRDKVYSSSYHNYMDG